MYIYAYNTYKYNLCIYIYTPLIAQEHDKQSGEGSYVCHRCFAKKGEFLSDVKFGLKTVDSRRKAIETAASGVDLPDIFQNSSSSPVVEFGEGGSFHRPGPNSFRYENARARCGAHLVFNAWLITHFCVHQMLMRDGMQAINIGIIITLIRAILRAFLEVVELILNIQGRAATKLEARFRNVLARRTGRDGQSFRGIHDCLVPVTPYLAEIFKHLRSKGKLPPRVRAVDMRHILLILPFLLQGLLTQEVEEHNKKNPVFRIVDPSSIMVEITIMLLSWYTLYRRKFPAKDEEDIKDLSTLGER